MKTVTQKDFQNLYQSPGFDRTEEMRRTLENLPEREAPERRAVIRKRRAAFILAAALALMGIAAVAVSNYPGFLVSWGGEIRENEVPEEGTAPQENLERMVEIVKTAPDDLYMIVSEEESFNAMHKSVSGTVHSLEELLQVLDAAGYRHPEQLVPDGWTFSSAKLDYSCDPEGSYELISRTEDGRFTIQQFRLDPKYRVVCGYTVNLEKGPEQGFISSGLTTGTDLSLGYPSDEELQAQAVSVPGMKDALYTCYGDGSWLMMYRLLEKPVTVLNQPYSAGEDGADAENYIAECTYEMILCENLEPDEVIPLFSGTP